MPDEPKRPLSARGKRPSSSTTTTPRGGSAGAAKPGAPKKPGDKPADKPRSAGAFLKSKLLDRVVLTVDKGANTQVYLAAAADTGGDRTKVGGLFFDNMKAVKPTEAAVDADLARALWALSEELTGTKFAL